MLKIFAAPRLPQDAAEQTIEYVQQLLTAMHDGTLSDVSSTLHAKAIQKGILPTGDTNV